MESSFWLFVKSFGDAFFTLLFFAILFLVVQYFIQRQKEGKSNNSIFRQMVLLLIASIGVISVILTLPISSDMKSNIVTLLGYAISAIVALSSATFFGNMLAGILLRIVNSFKPGDFIQVNEYFGRISERGLFHTELQTVDRDLITLPNLFLATNPVKVKRSTGSFITAEVSLGYDVNRNLIEKTLIEAATRAELTKPFVHITSLGDYSVVYKLHGLQKDIKKLLSAQSRLHAMVLDVLHEQNIEIVSPAFMNQRQVGETVFIPKKSRRKEEDLQETLSSEDLVFDKAKEAESIETKKERLEKIVDSINKLQAELKEATTDEQKSDLEEKIERSKIVRDNLSEVVDAKIDEIKEMD